MPSLFRLFGFIVYFWSNEGLPLEPIHVHIAKGTPSGNATKIWITEAGGCVLANNNSDIPQKQLNAIMDVIEAESDRIVSKWTEMFGEIRFYC